MTNGDTKHGSGTMNGFKVLGINDDVTTCECCGKSGLKKTVVLGTEDGGLVHFGTDCAAKAVYGRKNSTNAKLVETKAKAFDMAAELIAAGHTVLDAATVVAFKTGLKIAAAEAIAAEAAA